MKRCGSMSSASPLAAAALLLLAAVVCFFHCAAAARLLPSSVLVPADLVHHGIENGVKAAAADAGLVLQEAQGGVANGDELYISEMMGAESEEKPCEEGNDDEDCMQRRLLHEAHLDYIYTQHKGKP